MDRAVPTLIIVAVLLGLLALMLRSWRARARRDAQLVPGHPQPNGEATPLAEARVNYVATTPRERPLERLAIRGLGFRARGALTVTDAGVSVDLPGEQAVFIPAEAIEVLTPATVAIDRAVETDGLLRLGWRLHDTDTASGDLVSVDSYFRIPDSFDRDRITDAIRSIAVGAAGPTARDESEA
ncbi:MAG: hypothetical protein ABIX44_06085 [Cryobacterium sp.]